MKTHFMKKNEINLKSSITKSRNKHKLKITIIVIELTFETKTPINQVSNCK